MRHTGNHKKIIVTLQTQGPADLSDLIRLTRITRHPSRMRRMMYELEMWGYVRYRQDGRWGIADA